MMERVDFDFAGSGGTGLAQAALADWLEAQIPGPAEYSAAESVSL